MNDDAVTGVTKPDGSFRADVQKLIKMCGLTQKGIAERDLHVSTTKMSGLINSETTDWAFFERIIEICRAKISDGARPPALPENWDVLDYWHDRFEAERESRQVAETPATPDPGPETPESTPTAPAGGTSALRRAVIVGLGVAGIAAVVAGAVMLWGGNGDKGSAGPSSSVSSSASVAAAGDPRVEVSGTCVGADTQWQVKSSGFTPHGKYTVNVAYPDGKPYPLGGAGDRGTQGEANGDGSLNTRWQCYGPDPEGTYTMTVRDEATGKTATARFYVDKPG
ncbi:MULTISPECIES: hypothetical protein [unclassified Streptomyces]|uniref:hypothetical protein n=1 Tax=unclassified Streptomyces TaxID=2593676 RepID=UPI002E28C804|nr:hypothetical protein [Streptomyces sp. NBC_00228]